MMKEGAWGEFWHHFICHNHQRGESCRHSCSNHTIHNMSWLYNQENWISGMILVHDSCSNALFHSLWPASCSLVRQLVLIVICAVITMNMFRLTEIPIKLFLAPLRLLFDQCMGWCYRWWVSRSLHVAWTYTASCRCCNFQEIILLTALDVLLITRQNVVQGHPALILYATILWNVSWNLYTLSCVF
jgi:hypothetical protein